MRIGVLTTSYPREAGDPAGNFVAGFSRWLASQGAAVEVLATGPLRGAGWGERMRASLQLMKAARGRARAWDAVISHWLFPSATIGITLGLPHLAIAHGSDARLLAKLPGGRAWVRQIAARADLVSVAAALKLEGARVQPMGIEVAPFPRNRGGGGALFLGRLSYEKGLDRILPSPVRLIVAGDGPELENLKKIAGPNVELVGEVRGTRKRALLERADVLVLPSRNEGAPTVVMEAMACGLPVVATPAAAELVRHGETGLLCDAAKMWDEVARLTRDETLRARLARNARAAAQHYDWATVGPRLLGDLAKNFTQRADEIVAHPRATFV